MTRSLERLRYRAESEAARSGLDTTRRYLMKSKVPGNAAKSGAAAIQPNGDAKSNNNAGQSNHILPPDPEHMNDDRAKWAQAALRAFRKATGADEEEALGDLLCDLLHWSDRGNFDFEAALDRARMHYEAETTGEDAP
jgi:hypothetical protein